MPDSEELGVEDNAHLARILLAGRKVRLRSQFFSWVQGPLQALIPHEILLLGVVDRQGLARHECFSACRYFADEAFRRVSQPGSGLIAELGQDWQQARRVRLLPEADGAAADWPARLVALELRNLAFHGFDLPYGQGYGYVCFARLRCPLDTQLETRVEMLASVLMATLAQVLAQEALLRPAQASQTADRVTPRELEVLGWVREGKTNEEIAARLGLSSLTVKNHLFRATKKLDVRTRGQAVARCIALGLLALHSPPGRGVASAGSAAPAPDTTLALAPVHQRSGDHDG